MDWHALLFGNVAPGACAAVVFLVLWRRREAWRPSMAPPRTGEASPAQRLVPLVLLAGAFFALTPLLAGGLELPPRVDRHWWAVFAGVVLLACAPDALVRGPGVARWLIQAGSLAGMAWVLSRRYATDWTAGAWLVRIGVPAACAVPMLWGLSRVGRATGFGAAAVSAMVPLGATAMLPLAFYWLGGGLAAGLPLGVASAAAMVAIIRPALTIAHGTAAACALLGAMLLVHGTLAGRETPLAPMYVSLVMLSPACAALAPAGGGVARSIARVAAAGAPIVLGIAIASVIRFRGA